MLLQDVDCKVYQNTDYWEKSCNCTSTWLTSPPFTCRAGDVDYANNRWMKALSNNQYNQFLDYMCPKAALAGVSPPIGVDETMCSRPILGIYDDHDFGVNNGNKFFPYKVVCCDC